MQPFSYTQSTTFSPRQASCYKKRQPILMELCFGYYQPLLRLCSQICPVERNSKQKKLKTSFYFVHLLSLLLDTLFYSETQHCFSPPNICSFERIDKNILYCQFTHTGCVRQFVYRYRNKSISRFSIMENSTLNTPFV